MAENPLRTLFLDRDGVLNRRLPGAYVRNPAELEVLEGVADAMGILTKKFDRIFIVTNQAGIGKGLMNENDLSEVHDILLKNILSKGGRVDGIYHCPHRPDDNCACRKPRNGMALAAKQDFPEIDFAHATMAGDSESDMQFGKSLNMKTVFIHTNETASVPESADESFQSLLEFALQA